MIGTAASQPETMLTKLYHLTWILTWISLFGLGPEYIFQCIFDTHAHTSNQSCIGKRLCLLNPLRHRYAYIIRGLNCRVWLVASKAQIHCLGQYLHIVDWNCFQISIRIEAFLFTKSIVKMVPAKYQLFQASMPQVYWEIKANGEIQ